MLTTLSDDDSMPSQSLVGRAGKKEQTYFVTASLPNESYVGCTPHSGAKKARVCGLSRLMNQGQHFGEDDEYACFFRMAKWSLDPRRVRGTPTRLTDLKEWAWRCAF